MFIASTSTPTPDSNKEKTKENFLRLFGRSCEYMKLLEEIGLVKGGSYLKFEEQITQQCEKFIEENLL